MSTRSRPSSVMFAVVIATLTLLATGAGVAGQATPPVEDGVVAHPAHIHAGACPEVGDVMFPLNDLTPAIGPATMSEDGTPVASPAATSESTDTTGEVLAESTTDVDATLDDILAAEHAINVHESAENIQVYIACGDLIGTPTDGELHVQLEELNDSGVVGEARLIDNGDGTTTVTVSLYSSATATPAASPAS